MRYLLEFKSARVVMMGGNLEQSELRQLIEDGDAFFFSGEEKDYEKCPYSNKLIEEYPESFLECGTHDLARQHAIASKLTKKGLLNGSNSRLIGISIKMVSVAAREELHLVGYPPTLIVDNFELAKAASVPTITVAEFIETLKKKG